MKKPETAKTGKDPILKNTYNEFSIKTALVLAYFSTSAALSSMPSTPRLRAGLRRQYRKYKDKSNYVQCPVRTIKPTLTRPRLDAPAREGLSLALILSHPLHTSRCQRYVSLSTSGNHLGFPTFRREKFDENKSIWEMVCSQMAFQVTSS